jgi:hypothetical protein
VPIIGDRCAPAVLFPNINRRRHASDRAWKELDSFGSDWRVVTPVEGDAELVIGPPRHSASAVCMPISETQFETIRDVARVHEFDAGPTISEVDNGARDRRAVREDFGALQNPGAPNASALMHGLACRWEARLLGQDTRSMVSFSSALKAQVLPACKSIQQERVNSR